jgi:hypothetical protein
MGGAIFDPTTNAWTALSPAPVVPRRGFALVSATTTHELVLWGGFNEAETGDTLYADGAVFSLAKDTWRTIAPTPLPAGGTNFTTWDGARMVIVYPRTIEDGGGPQSAAAAYDPAMDAWTMLPLPAIRPRIDAATAGVRHGTALSASAIFGGLPFAPEDPIPGLRDGAWLDSDTGTWTTIPDPGMALYPGDIFFRTSFGGAGRFFIWGGRSDAGPDVGTGMAFDLTSGKWSAMPTAGAPSPRESATAVWTGCDAIVLGGADLGVRLMDGALLRP